MAWHTLAPISSAWSSHLGMSGFLAVARVTLAARTRARRGIVHLRTPARRELSFTLVVTTRLTGDVDASQRWRAATQSVGSPLRRPWIACVDGAVRSTRAKQPLCPAAALVRVTDCFRAAEPA